MKLQLNESKLDIFHEGRKRRVYVGELSYNEEKDIYEFLYDPKYIKSKKAIPVGPELDLFKRRHTSQKGKLFPSFQDRIPSKENPAYVDYCRALGISPNEKNPIILLGSIGQRGPSSFVFTPSYKNEFSRIDILQFRKRLHITRYDLAEALDFSLPTIERIETGKSKDRNTLRQMQIYLEFPEVALWQLKLTGGRVHGDVLQRLIQIFESKISSKKSDKDTTLYLKT